MGQRYDDLNQEELLRLLEARDRRDTTKFGLVWEANEIERDKALNNDFVALDLVPELSVGTAPWRNLIIEGDNFDALRYLRMTFAGQVKCINIDPPYNTGEKDFIYNDRFVDKEHSWRHSMWLEFMYRRLLLARDSLTKDGVLLVNIGEDEVHRLGCLRGRPRLRRAPLPRQGPALNVALGKIPSQCVKRISVLVLMACRAEARSEAECEGWWARSDLNRGPSDYESLALTN